MGSHIVYIDGALRSCVGKRYKQVKLTRIKYVVVKSIFTVRQSVV